MRKVVELRVVPLNTARSFLANGWATNCVSLIDPGTAPPPAAPHHLVLHFEDARDNVRHPAVLPTAADAERIISFADAVQPGARLLVHCHTAMGRSPAVAIALLVRFGDTPDEAVAKIAEIRPWMNPNHRLLSYLDTAMGLQGAMLAAARRWQEHAAQH